MDGIADPKGPPTQDAITLLSNVTALIVAGQNSDAIVNVPHMIMSSMDIAEQIIAEATRRLTTTP